MHFKLHIIIIIIIILYSHHHLDLLTYLPFHCFQHFCASIWDYFPSAWKTLFTISFSMVPLVINFLNFCWSEEVFIQPFIYEEYFHWVENSRFLVFSTLKMSWHWFRDFTFLLEKSIISLIITLWRNMSLKVMCLFSRCFQEHLKISLIFSSFTGMCLSLIFSVLVPMGVCRTLWICIFANFVNNISLKMTSTLVFLSPPLLGLWFTYVRSVSLCLNSLFWRNPFFFK